MGEAELFVIRNINIPALPKSWIIVFQSLELRDTITCVSITCVSITCVSITRGEIAKGFQPWMECA